MLSSAWSLNTGARALPASPNAHRAVSIEVRRAPGRQSTHDTMSTKKAKLQVVAGKSVTGSGAKPAKPPASAPMQTAAAPKPAANPRLAPSGLTPSGLAPSAPVQVSGRWLLLAVSGVLALAALCAWGSLCLLFWQGGWQLLYHPSALIARTPAASGLRFDPIGFATTGTGMPRLAGWWVPAAVGARFSRYTVLYLHAQDGNLGNAVDDLAQLHAAGVNVFAFDYRGYGQSQFARPSEKHWLEDAGSALQYLTATRHIPPAAIVLDGSNLGADLALECAAAHPQLAGVVIESPVQNVSNVIFNDARARLVPARLLVRDRYNLTAAAAALRIPSLWFLPTSGAVGGNALPGKPDAYQKISASKTIVWLPPTHVATKSFTDEFSRWLDDLQAR